MPVLPRNNYYYNFFIRTFITSVWLRTATLATFVTVARFCARAGNVSPVRRGGVVTNCLRTQSQRIDTLLLRVFHLVYGYGVGRSERGVRENNFERLYNVTMIIGRAGAVSTMRAYFFRVRMSMRWPILATQCACAARSARGRIFSRRF